MKYMLMPPQHMHYTLHHSADCSHSALIEDLKRDCSRRVYCTPSCLIRQFDRTSIFEFCLLALRPRDQFRMVQPCSITDELHWLHLKQTISCSKALIILYPRLFPNAHQRFIACRNYTAWFWPTCKGHGHQILESSLSNCLASLKWQSLLICIEAILVNNLIATCSSVKISISSLWVILAIS